MQQNDLKSVFITFLTLQASLNSQTLTRRDSPRCLTSEFVIFFFDKSTQQRTDFFSQILRINFPWVIKESLLSVATHARSCKPSFLISFNSKSIKSKVYSFLLQIYLEQSVPIANGNWRAVLLKFFQQTLWSDFLKKSMFL